MGVLIGMHTTDFREYSLTFIFYLIIVHAISGVLNKIMYISESFTQIDGSVERMDEILRIPVLPEKSTAATIENYGIAFRDVSFSYEADSQVKALSHVSFFADQGKVTAIVGPSGGGKSTIASLISRFYDVTDGSIQIGGVDIRDIPLDALMDKVSFVFQDTFLFKQSILDNIRMGNPDATEEQVIAAAKAARCHEFIEQLPNGYQTVIGQHQASIFRQLQRLCQQNGTCMVYNYLFFYTDRLSGVVVRTAQVIAINALWQIITGNPPIGEQTGFIKQLDLLILLVIGNLNLFLIVELAVGNLMNRGRNRLQVLCIWDIL